MNLFIQSISQPLPSYQGKQLNSFATNSISHIIQFKLPRHLMCSHFQMIADSKVHGAIMGLIWGRQDPGGSHVGPMNFAIWGNVVFSLGSNDLVLLPFPTCLLSAINLLQGTLYNQISQYPIFIESLYYNCEKFAKQICCKLVRLSHLREMERHGICSQTAEFKFLNFSNPPWWSWPCLVPLY